MEQTHSPRRRFPSCIVQLPAARFEGRFKVPKPPEANIGDGGTTALRMGSGTAHRSYGNQGAP